MGGSWIEEKFEDYKLQLNFKQQCLNVWELIELIGMGHFSKGMDRQTLSMGINEVFQELILDVLKQVSALQICTMYIMSPQCFFDIKALIAFLFLNLRTIYLKCKCAYFVKSLSCNLCYCCVQ